MRRQKIASLINTNTTSVDLSTESKPLRETLQANYGVSYREDINAGGSTNVRIQGESYYLSPGRQMRRDELENRQVRERQSKAADYQKSMKGEFVSMKGGDDAEAASSNASQHIRHSQKRRHEANDLGKL